MSCIKKDFTVKVEQEKCEDTCIPNVDDKQKFIDVSVNCDQFSKFRYTLLEEILKKDRVFASKEIKIVFEKFYLFCERIDSVRMVQYYVSNESSSCKLFFDAPYGLA